MSRPKTHVTSQGGSVSPPPHFVAGATELRQSGESPAFSAECGCLGNRTREPKAQDPARLAVIHGTCCLPPAPLCLPRLHGPHQRDGGCLVSVLFLGPGRMTSAHAYFPQPAAVNYRLCTETRKSHLPSLLSGAACVLALLQRPWGLTDGPRKVRIVLGSRPGEAVPLA